MMSIDHNGGPQSVDDRHGPQIVAIPPLHEGLTQALLGSFRSVPVLPADFARLLDRLHVA